jgi:phospholipid transport system substrate-binding protein
MFKTTAKFLAAIAVITMMGSQAFAGQASTVVEKFYDQLQATMKQGHELGFSGRYKKLEPVIQSSFDLPTMTRFSIGPAWSKTAPEQQQQLIKAFTNFSVANYASRFAKYDGEKFEVIGEKPASGGGVIVETKLTPEGEEPVSLNYLMRESGGSYKIVDVYMASTISELATRRAEFGAIVRREGVAALVDTLGEKTKKMGPS